MVFCNLLDTDKYLKDNKGHNPYFSRWFSAIKLSNRIALAREVTILILVDGFLQYEQYQVWTP